MIAISLPALFPVALASADEPGFSSDAALVCLALGLLAAAVLVLGLQVSRLAARVRTLDDELVRLGRAPAPSRETAPPAPAVPASAPAPAPAPAVAAPEAELPVELVAVIAAAVKLSVQGAYRISAIIPVASQDWAQDGRRQIFASHQIR